MSRFTERHLDPGSRFGEILFGLIMVLTVTLAAGFNACAALATIAELAICDSLDAAIDATFVFAIEFKNANRKQQLLVEGGDSCLCLVAQLSAGLGPAGSRSRRYARRLFASRSIRRRFSSQLASASRSVRLFVCRPGLLDLLQFASDGCFDHF